MPYAVRSLMKRTGNLAWYCQESLLHYEVGRLLTYHRFILADDSGKLRCFRAAL